MIVVLSLSVRFAKAAFLECRTTTKAAFALRPSSAAFPKLSITQNRNQRWMTTTASEAATSATDTLRYDELNRSRGIVGNYEPSQFESDVYQWWEHAGCFLPDAKTNKNHKHDKNTHSQKKPYVLPMPPPNVTGKLHMGHAIFVALQDVLARFHRMRGRPVLWLPGTDHAGIATQLQVEKLLISEGTNRKEVGREAFLERVWAYKTEQGGAITRQLRSLGASADWSRERFTMDEDLSASVVEAFVRLHEKGLVYRGEYMVNWAPLLQTAVSDLEVEYSEEVGKLYYFKYMVEDSDGKWFHKESKILPSVIVILMADMIVRKCVNIYRVLASRNDASRNHCGGYRSLCAPG
jgi:valyl-tRNA synthetase